MSTDASRKKKNEPKKSKSDQPHVSKHYKSAGPDGHDDKFLVVGVGASAGGIQALKEFFTQVKADSGMAYVVILHMSPEHKSKLAEILQVTSPIPVTQVVDREKIHPNHVYVIPPNQNLLMTDGHLTLTDMIGLEERRSPVDLFFRTLAEANEDRAVSVVLSGTGANGSMGLKRIKEHGGVAFVQDPDEAQYSDMPRNAIATGMVDYVLSVAEIPPKIVSYREHFNTVQLPPVDDVRTDEQALIDIFTQLRIRTGHDFSNYKRATILRRIERRLGIREMNGLAPYAHYLRDHSEEVHALMKDLLISVTNFFRDSASIDALEMRVIPRIFEAKDPDDPIRVWVAGCATGEEAYSIAMVLSEFVDAHGRPPNFQVFATDLDHDAVQVAREGYYKDAEVADVPPERLRRFFNRDINGYRVRRELRESILFAVHNVIKDPPFSHLDLVSCRNLMIYLNRTAQSRVLEVLHFALNPSGYLFLGASESVDGAGDLFAAIDKEHHIYRSRPVPPRAFPIPETTLRPPRPIVGREKTTEETRAMERLSYADLHQRLLEGYGPPSVVVNEEYEVVHLSERAGKFMQVPGGEPSHNILKLVRPELRLELRTALYQAVHDRVSVEARGLKLVYEDHEKLIDILVRPVLRDEDPIRGFLLVLFQEPTMGAAPSKVAAVSESDEPLARRLEEELIHSRAQLRATVEQYEIQQEELRASNEELQAMNEELRSSAEELETSKEELQSVNEELTTVNQELKIKIEELSHANNNFANLMNSTNIGTIFLDRTLRVRQFTPAARDTFNLIGSDIGRPLMDITNKLQNINLIKDLEEVLATLRTTEHEVSTDTGRSFLMRLSPYRTVEEKIEGLIITLWDVTELALAREELEQVNERTEEKIEARTRELAASNSALRTEISERLEVEKSRARLRGQVVKAQEDERKRFALDLHDQLGQQLTALRLKLETLQRQSSAQPQIPERVDELLGIVKHLDADVDFLAWQLRPVALDDLGLVQALSNYVRQFGERFDIVAELHAGDLHDTRFDSVVEAQLYRIAQEALNNCAKHADCTRANVLLERRHNNVVLIVEDNGRGFDFTREAKTEQLGLLGMRERAALMGGTLEIESAPNKGTTVFARVPVTLEGGSMPRESKDG